MKVLFEQHRAGILLDRYSSDRMRSYALSSRACIVC